MVRIAIDFEQEERILRQIVTVLEKQIVETARAHGTREDEIRTWLFDLAHDFKRDGSDVIGWLQHIQWFRQAQSGVDTAEHQLARLRRQLQQPYFGGFDFRMDEESEAETFRLGLFGITDPLTPVYDWRAPVASLYYDAEPGPASYRAPAGTIAGHLLDKRQYVIRQGQLRGAFATTLPIGDDVLQQSMASHSDVRMTNIVATIQRQQNQAIRTSSSGHLLVDGPAGSGKTSVALQRIAFLLYRERRTVRAAHILFLSPSPLFADYVSAVLPELGEENPWFQSVEDLWTAVFLENPPESRLTSLDRALSTHAHAEASASLLWKASPALLGDLENYLEQLAEKGLPFRPFGPPGLDPWVSAATLSQWFTDDFAHHPVRARLDQISERLAALVKRHEAALRRLVQDRWQQVATDEAGWAERVEQELVQYQARIQSTLVRVAYVDWMALYRQWFNDDARPDGVPASDWGRIRSDTIDGLNASRIPYQDQAAILWLRATLSKVQTLPSVRLLVVDEAQDYTPCQYSALARLFPDARLTAVGDSRQWLHPGYGIPRLQDAVEAFLPPDRPPASCVSVHLTTCYRSSPAIMEFAGQVLPESFGPTEVADLHWDQPAPSLIEIPSPAAWGPTVAAIIAQAKALGYARIAVIGRTLADAQWMAKGLAGQGEGPSVAFQSVYDPDAHISDGTLVLPLALAKGLEFDAVILGDVSETSYNTAHDRLLLYTAATRAIFALWMITLGPTATWFPRPVHSSPPDRGAAIG